MDLVVNILTNLAYHKNLIKIFGGSQLRPNIHIDDMVRSYICVLNAKKKLIQDQIFNVGFENYSVEKLALMVKKNIKSKINLEYTKSDDNRSSLSYKLKNILSMFAKNVLTTDPYIQDDKDLINLQKILKDSDILILATPHKVYKKIKTKKKIIDIWNFFNLKN